MEEQPNALQATTVANTAQQTQQNPVAHIPVAPPSQAQPLQLAESVHNSNVGNQPQKDMPAWAAQLKTEMSSVKEKIEQSTVEKAPPDPTTLVLPFIDEIIRNHLLRVLFIIQPMCIMEQQIRMTT